MGYSGPWRAAGSVTTLRLQLNEAFPGRSHASDGTIADDAHSTTSGHYPHRYPVLGSTPVVTAFDGTHDPAHGCDGTVITEAIRVSRDPRVLYVIWNRQMYSSYPAHGYPAWTWRPYTGSDDPHTNHFHVSVVSAAIADSTAPWTIGGNDVSVLTDQLIAGLNQGTPKLPDGSPNYLVQRQIALEKWQNNVTEALTAMEQKVTGLAAGGVTHEQLVAALLDPAVQTALADATFKAAQRAEQE